MFPISTTPHAETPAGNSPGPTAFERCLADSTGAGCAVAFSSVPCALEALLRALPLEPGQEVILSALAEPSLAAAVVRAGGIPLLADIEPGTGQICPRSAASCRTVKTRALILSHQNGVPCQTAPFQEDPLLSSLLLIEDCTEAFGAENAGNSVGRLGHAALFSFSADALSGHGVAALTTDDPELARRLRRNCLSPGFFPAAFTPSFLTRSRYGAERRAAIAALYAELLGPVGEIQLPAFCFDTRPAWSRFVIRVPDRVELLRTIALLEPELRPLPVELSAPSAAHPNAGSLADEGLALPVHPDLTDDQVIELGMAIYAHYTPPGRRRMILPVPFSRARVFRGGQQPVA